MEALGVIGFVLALVVIGRFEALKKEVTKLRTEVDELRGQSVDAAAPESD